MVILVTPHRAVVLLSLITLVYLAFVMSKLRNHAVLNVQQRDAPIGLMPQRQGLFNLDVAVIVCYRARVIQLKIFINYMNLFLLSQNSSARIYVIEQDGKDPFNRAKLFNVGYTEAKKDCNYSCFIFHDVDLIPENPRLIYQCANQPLHLSAFIDTFNYRLPYKSIFGGVSALTDQQLKTVNGFPNGYWGWGGEDDDLSRRVVMKNYTIKRLPRNVARYTMLKFTGRHTQSKPNKSRFKQLRMTRKNMAKDGLSNLKYDVIKKVDHKTHIWILIDLKHKV